MKALIPFLLILIGVSFDALSAALTDSTPRSYQTIEAQIRGVTQPGNIWIERGRMQQAVWNDQSYLRSFETSKNGAGLIAAIGELETKWRKDSPDGYVQVMASATIQVQFGICRLRYLQNEPNLEQVIQYYGSNVLTRLPFASLETAGRAMKQLSMDVGGSCGEDQRTALDQIGRETALAPYLELLNRVETLMAIPAPSEWIGFTTAEREDIESGGTPASIGGVPVPANEQIDRADRIREFLHCRETFGPGEPQKVKDGWSGWQGVLETGFTAFLQRRYTGSETDLDEVQQAFDKCLTAPGLKERVILAAYKGKNPFADRRLSSLTQRSFSHALVGIVRPVSAGETVPQTPVVGSPAALPAVPRSVGGETGSPMAISVSSATKRSLPYLPLASVLAVGLVLFWHLSRSRPG